MIQQDNTAQAIQSCSDTLNIDEDIQALDRITHSVDLLRQSRLSHRIETRSLLQKLSRQLEMSRDSRQVAAKSRQEKIQHHDEVMARLERDKFELARQINDLETDNQALEATVASLEERLQQDDEYKVVDSSPESDKTVLQLNLFRSLGIRLVPNANNHEFTKAVITSIDGKDIHSLALDKGYSRFFVSNYMWDMLTI